MKLFFFLPKKELGGAEILFIRIIKSLLNDNANSITVCDYPDGIVFNNLEGKNFTFIPFHHGSKINISKDYTLFIPLIFVHLHLGKTLFPEGSTKVFLWDLGAFGNIEGQILIDKYRKVGIEKAIKLKNKFEKRRNKKISAFIDNALVKKGLYYMNKKDFYYDQLFFNIQQPPRYLPIPVDIEEQNNQVKALTTNSINIAWISRLVPAKIKPLLLLINDISKHTDYQVKLHVIGDGPEENFLRKYAISKNVNVILTGRLEFSELKEYIGNKIDLGFSMGTAALEFAMNSIPSVLTLGAITLKKDWETNNTYKWLFYDQDYNLASEPTISPQDSKSFKDILSEFSDNPPFFSDKSYEHVKKHHNILIVLNKINQYFRENMLTYSDIKKSNILSYSWYDKILSFYLKSIKYTKNLIK